MLRAPRLVSRCFGIFLVVFQVMSEVRMPTLQPSLGLASTNTEYYTSIYWFPDVPMKCNLVLMLQEFQMHLFVLLQMARRRIQHVTSGPASLQMFWYKFAGFSKCYHWQDSRCEPLSPLGSTAANPISNTPICQSPGVPLCFGGASRVAARFMMISQGLKISAEFMTLSILHRLSCNFLDYLYITHIHNPVLVVKKNTTCCHKHSTVSLNPP